MKGEYGGILLGGSHSLRIRGPGQVLNRGDRPYPRLAYHRCVAILLLCVAVATTGSGSFLLYLLLGPNAGEMVARASLQSSMVPG